MPWSGVAPNQTFARTDGTRTGTTVWQQAEGASVDIISTDHDTHDQDIGTAINGLLKKDGGNQPSANLPMGGFKHTNVADATALTHYATLSQLITKGNYNVGTVGGTGDAVTLTTGFSLTAYTTGMRFSFVIGATNTTTTTVNVDSIGTKTVKRLDGSNLQAADWIAGRVAEIKYDGTNFQWLNTFVDIGTGDTVIQVAERRTTPPGSPADGSYYILTGTPGGAWSTFEEHDLALYVAASSSWTEINPEAGWLAYVVDEEVNYQFNGTTWVQWSNVSAPASSNLQQIVVQDVKAQNTSGGSTSTGAWNKRDLNTVVENSITGASIDTGTSQVTLPAGDYLVIHFGILYGSAVSRQRFKSTTTSKSVVSINTYSTATSGSSVIAVGRITLSSQETFELQHRTTSAETSTGLGFAMNISGETEIYAQVQILSLSSMQGPQGDPGSITEASDGSAADPGIRFAAAATGLYRSSGNLGVAIAGTEKVVFGSSSHQLTGQLDEKVGALTLANGSNDNVTLPSATFVRVTGPTGVFNVTGFASGRDGQRLQLYNSTAQNMTITNDATSTAANRILTLTGADVALTGTSVADFRYSTDDSRWILTGTQG